MAMIKCPECGQEISDIVNKCPHCGFPINKKRIPIRNILIISIALIFIIIIGVIVNYTRLDKTEKNEVNQVYTAISDIGEVTKSSEKYIEKAENLYTSLSRKCQFHVKNHKQLVEARKTYDNLIAQDTIKLISGIGEVTIDSQSVIEKAQTSYDSLTDEQKKLVKNANELKEAKKELSSKKIKETCNRIDKIGNITVESQEKIKYARDLYDSLSDDEKEKVTNYDILVDAEQEYSELEVKECMSTIDSIGKVTLKSKEKINKAKQLYNSLEDDLQAKVSNYNTLKKASDKYEKLKKQEEERKRTLKQGDKLKTSQWEITYKKTNISAKVQPDNTSGYYMYYYADDDSTFVDIVFRIKNIDKDILGIEDLISDCKVKYDGSDLTKSYTLYISNGSQIDQVYSWDGLDALDSTTLHVAINMPREIQSNKKSITVNLTVAGEEKIIHVR